MQKYAIVLAALYSFMLACVVPAAPEPSPPKSAKSGAGDERPETCQCSPDYEELGCNDGDSDVDCVCNGEDNCRAHPNCDRANADGDAFGDVCDELPNTPSPETTLASLDARLDALEAAGTGTAVTALQYDVAALAAALAEIRTKYPSHYHGLLGLNGDPVGSSGDLNYELPGDP